MSKEPRFPSSGPQITIPAQLLRASPTLKNYARTPFDLKQRRVIPRDELIQKLRECIPLDSPRFDFDHLPSLDLAAQQMGKAPEPILHHLEGLRIGVAEAHGPSTKTMLNILFPKPMEDAHVITSLRLNHPEELTIPCFIVIDGHSGSLCAKHIAQELSGILESELVKSPQLDEANISEALTLACLEVDAQFRATYHDKPESQQGAVVSVSLLIKKQLWVANVGDSRTVIRLGDQVKQLSLDAVPTEPTFRQSLQKRGLEGKFFWKDPSRCGWCCGDCPPEGVQAIPRVAKPLSDGFEAAIMPARVIGDAHLPGVSSRPTKHLEELEDGQAFLLLMATDGLWDVMGSEEAVLFLEATLNSNESDDPDLALKEALKALRLEAFLRGAKDNVTLVTIQGTW